MTLNEWQSGSIDESEEVRFFQAPNLGPPQSASFSSKALESLCLLYMPV